MINRRALFLALPAIALAAVAAPQLGDRAAAAPAQRAIFAGGCFWCVEEAFDAVPGVTATTSGYSGGSVENPTYRQVTAGGTGHYEVVKVEYDPAKVTYDQLLQVFWRNIDPFDAAGQFCDKGDSYKSAILTSDPEEQATAEASLGNVAARFKQPIATKILPAAEFYPAEDYHQDYYITTSLKYQFYKSACGRAARLEEIWGKPST